MTTEHPNIARLAWIETLSEVKLSSPTAALLTIGGSLTTIAATYLLTGSVAISAVCTICLLLVVAISVFTIKLFVIPRRLLRLAIAERNERVADKQADSISPPAPHDLDLFRKFTGLITSQDLDWIGGFHFGDDIPRAALAHVRAFYVDWNKPRHTFLSEEMNARFDEVKAAAEVFMTSVVANTMPSDRRRDYLTVRTGQDPYGVSDQTKSEVKEINDAATQFVETTIAFHHVAMRLGFTFE